MKWKWILFLFILSTKAIYAQKTQGFDAGLVFGINATQIDGDRMGGFNKVGIRAGLYAQRTFKKDWAYRIEMAYSQKGSKRIYDENGPIGGIWDKANADYIEVPLLFIFHHKSKFNFMGGISNGFIMRKKVMNDFFGETSAEFFRKYEGSFIIGSSYPINKNWSIEGRYQQSILSVAKSQFPIYSYLTNFMIHKMLTVQLAYKLQQ
ncbi:MAG: PorT family protein [Bacteroidetes bacterium]|nr:PorT family protein [Bacteroidota bacterium]